MESLSSLITKVSNMVPKHGLGGRIRANLIPNHPQDPFFPGRRTPIVFPLFSLRRLLCFHGGQHIAAVVFTFAPSRLVFTFAPSRLVVAELSALVGSHRARGHRPRKHPTRVAGFSSRAGTTCVRPRELSSRVPCSWRFGAPAGVVFPCALSSSARGCSCSPASSLHAARGHPVVLCPVEIWSFFLCFCRDNLRLLPVTVVTVFLPLVCLLQVFSHVIAAQHYCYQHYP